MKRIAVMILLMIMSLSANNLNDAQKLYEQGARNYSVSTLKNTLSLLSEELSGKDGEEGVFDYYLLQGKCYARIQFIYKVKDDISTSEGYGKKALIVLEEAIEANSNSIEAWAAHSIALQNLTGLSTAHGMLYGPMLGTGMNKLKKLNPDHFYTRFVDGIWKLRAPLMFGGDRRKALEIFSDLHMAYPQDEDVSLNLAVAYVENGKKSEALTLVNSVLIGNPANLWAEKLAGEFE